MDTLLLRRTGTSLLGPEPLRGLGICNPSRCPAGVGEAAGRPAAVGELVEAGRIFLLRFWDDGGGRGGGEHLDDVDDDGGEEVEDDDGVRRDDIDFAIGIFEVYFEVDDEVDVEDGNGNGEMLVIGVGVKGVVDLVL